MGRINKHKKHEVLYTDRQRETIRASLMEYYEFQRAGPRRATWGGICDEIFDDRHLCIEDFRQWATRFVAKGRKTPRRPHDGCLKTVATFLMHPDVDMLLPQELEDPEPPYRFPHSFLKFLSDKPASGVLPQALNGVYDAWHQVEQMEEIEEKWVKTILTLKVDYPNRIIRATETWEIHFLGPNETSVVGGDRPGEGWGIATPEGNLFLFMKTQPYLHNYCYLTLTVNPKLWTDFVVNQLTLLRHEGPADGDPTSKTFEELTKKTRGRTLILNFNKVSKLNPDRGE
jgi:hypothetical protein